MLYLLSSRFIGDRHDAFRCGCSLGAFLQCSVLLVVTMLTTSDAAPPPNCSYRFVAPPAPLHATDHNGVKLPDTCFGAPGPHHFFVIGDWGGIYKDGIVQPADHTCGSHGGKCPRQFVGGVDDWAQMRVATQMKKLAPIRNIDFVINLGDNFYWGGLEGKCGTPAYQHPESSNEQWQQIFEWVYHGPGLDGKQWLGVLGNHDYGGWSYLSAWDQAIGYTWGVPGNPAGSTGRWMTPALYWSVTVHYDVFSADFYFMDSNKFDALAPEDPSGHNLCSYAHNPAPATCGAMGPYSQQNCQGWFYTLWAKEMQWLERVLPESTAKWQIIVTHFPPAWATEDWSRLSEKHGIDLILTGHRHMQEVIDKDTPPYEFFPGVYTNFLGPTAWVVSGGGGGVTSEKEPDVNGNDDQYGFVDIAMTNELIVIQAISHGGQVRKTSKVPPRPAVYERIIASEGPAGADDAADAAGAAVPAPAADGAGAWFQGCDNEPRSFYAYRAQNDANYPNENVNAADMAGVLWYLHHEVVNECPRKFGVTRIRRLKVTMKNTCELWNQEKTQFGPYVAFDTAQCTVPNCPAIWQKYGFVVGCQHLPYNTGMWGAYGMPDDGTTRRAHWYSLPGSCPSARIGAKSPQCVAAEKGGVCDWPSGDLDCTFKVEDAGDLRLEEMYTFSGCSDGQIEYNNQTDKGVGVKFWDGIFTPEKCAWRIKYVQDKFAQKYPGMPRTLEDPECDWHKSDPNDWLHRTGSGFTRPGVHKYRLV